LGLVLFFFYFKFRDSTFAFYDNRDKRIVQLASILSLAVGYAYFEGISSTLSVAEALSILNSANIFDWLIQKMLRNENPSSSSLISAALSAAGTLLIWQPHLESPDHYGCMICLGGALSLCLIESVYKTKNAHISPLCLLFYSMMVSAVASPVLGFFL
jgi:hypothetical protein